MATKTCPNCGMSAGKMARFCKSCGTAVRDAGDPDAAPILTDAALDRLEAGAAPDPDLDDDEPELVTAWPDAPAEPAAVTSAPPLPPAAVNGTYTLTVISGLNLGRSITLEPGRSVVAGSSDDADLSIRGDDTLSRRHVVFEVSEDGLTAADCGSTNGTFIVIKAARRLEPGDLLVLGSTLLRVEKGG